VLKDTRKSTRKPFSVKTF